jgi:hypothetical protein
LSKKRKGESEMDRTHQSQRIDGIGLAHAAAQRGSRQAPKFFRVDARKIHDEQATLDAADDRIVLDAAAKALGGLGDQRIGRAKAVRRRDLANRLEPHQHQDAPVCGLALLERRLEVEPVGQAREPVRLGRHAQIAPHREVGADGERQFPERVTLGRAQRPRLHVHHAQGADSAAFAGLQRISGVEPGDGRAGAEHGGHEAGIRLGVVYFEQAIRMLDCVGAERDVARSCCDLDPQSRLEPLALAVQQCDRADRCFTDHRSQPHQAVERGLRLSVQDAEVVQMGQPLGFVGRQGGWDVGHGSEAVGVVPACLLRVGQH